MAGLSYEVLKLAAASDALPARIVRAPGLVLQYLTTREPEADMLEVALAAFRLAMDPPASGRAADAPAAAGDVPAQAHDDAPAASDGAGKKPA